MNNTQAHGPVRASPVGSGWTNSPINPPTTNKKATQVMIVSPLDLSAVNTVQKNATANPASRKANSLLSVRFWL